MPKFKSTEHTDSGPLGTVSSTFIEIDGRRQTVVADSTLGYLINKDAVYEGHWHGAEGSWTFTPSANSAALDHDHCAICWQSLDGLTETAEHFAAAGHDDDRYHATERTCVKCYEQHVSRNDISFVPAAFDLETQK